MQFQVEQQRFGLTTKDASKAPIVRDLAVSIFTLLEHTPLDALGLNLHMGYSLESKQCWNDVGHSLAPKVCWNGILEKPGLAGMTMRGQRTDCSADRIDIRVHPTPEHENGVYVGFNQHYDIKTEHRKSIMSRNREALRILQEDWNTFRSYAQKAAVNLLQNAIAGGTVK